MNTRGATLLELIIAVLLATVCIISLSLVFPKTTKTITINRQRTIASNFANSRMQELTQQTYAYIDPTPMVTNGAWNGPAVAPIFPYVGGTNATGGCDCGQANFAAIPNATTPIDATPTLNDASITYTRRSCVNFVERNTALNTWVTYCPTTWPSVTDLTDHGLKMIRVRVSWQVGSDPYFIDVENMVSR